MAPRPRQLVIALVLLATLFAASFPYLYGLAIRPAGTLFWAVPLVNYLDANQYLALTRQAAEGRLLLADPFTQQPHVARLFLPEVLAEAAVCRVFGVSPLMAFHVSRVASGALLLLAGYWLGTLFLPRFRQLSIYVGLLCFSAGANWFVARLGLPWFSGDLYQPEANTFHTLANLPHLSLSAALLTTLFATLASLELGQNPSESGFGAVRDKRCVWLLVLASGCALLLAWTHPFDLVTYTLGAGSYTFLRWIGSRELPKTAFLHLAVVFLGASPAALYLLWLVKTDPVYRALADDPSGVQELRFYALAHGILLLPAVTVLFRTEMRRRYLLPLCWVACAFLFLLTPFRMGGKQQRLLGGVHAPLALLAAAGIEDLARRAFGRLSPSSQTAGVLGVGAAYLVITGTGAVGIIQMEMSSYAARGPGFYLSPAVQGLFRYLDQHGDHSQLTLGGPYTGGWAPGLADTPVFHGHWQMTLHEPQKRAERDWFFHTSTDSVRKAAWLRENGIKWVICYPWEWKGQLTPPDGVPNLQRVYQTPEIWLYRYGE